MSKEGEKVKVPGWGIALFGVGLPAGTLLFELFTNVCAETLSDPVPTPLHVVLVAAVPAAIAWIAYQMRQQRVTKTAVAALGVALGVSSYYATIFLPITPLALIMILYFGLGLLAVAPLFSFFAGYALLRRIRQLGVSLKPAAFGAATAWLLLLGAELPNAANRVWMGWATSEAPEDRARGLALLRSWGDPDQLLRACYQERTSNAGILSYFLRKHTPGPRQARALYFRVTGESFNSAPRPAIRSLRRAFDDDVGGDKVAGRVDGLVLASSRLDGSVAHDASVGYLEWTWVLSNTSPMQQEGRALIALPSGGVVSRATLWVNGEPKEATFAAKGKARAAYEKVVKRRRDPLLVTQPSPERVLVQCFPVPPTGQMKIRIGITFPLTPASDARAQFTLPYIAEQNFEIPADAQHAVWIGSDEALHQSGSKLEKLAQGHGLRGVLSSDALRQAVMTGSFAPKVHFSEVPAPPVVSKVLQESTSVTSGPLAGSEAAIEATPAWHVIQRFRREPLAKIRGWVVALDTSQTLAAQKERLADLLSMMLEHAPLTLVLASDSTPRVLKFQAGTGSGALRSELSQTDFLGGRDSVAAAAKALEVASNSGLDKILWVTAPQPEGINDLGDWPTDTSSALLEQWLTRPDEPLRLVPFNFGNGELDALRGLPASSILRPARNGHPIQELEAYVRSLAGGSRWRVERVYSSEPVGEAHQTGPHLTRLWALEHVERGCPSQTAEECMALAVKHQLVTSLTGAVVLETVEQYREAGLEPSDGTDVPTVPEPATWILVLLMLGALAVGSTLRRRAAG